MSSDDLVESILYTGVERIATCELRLYVNMPIAKRDDPSKNYSIEYFRCYNCNGRKIKCPAYKPAYKN